MFPFVATPPSGSNPDYLYGTGESIPSGTYRFGKDIAPGWYSLADPKGIVVTPAFFPSGAIVQSTGAFVLFSASIDALEVPDERTTG